jgi:hypothetical protein
MYSMPDGRTQPLFSKPALAFDLTSLGRKSGYRNVARAEKHTSRSADAPLFLLFFNVRNSFGTMFIRQLPQRGTINAVGFVSHVAA